MDTKSIILSSAGLRNISLSIFTENDNFTLIFGKKKFKLNRIFAEFISPVISRIHYSDPTIESFEFIEMYPNKTDDFTKFCEDILSDETILLLQQISSGISTEIDHAQAFKLRFLSIILGNEELFTKINDSFPPDLTKETVATYLNYIQSCYHFSQLCPSFSFSYLVEYISQHFYSIPKEDFLKLPRTMQYSIISNAHLQIKSEDSLLDTIIEIIEKDESSENAEEIESVSFLEQVEFASLSEEKLRDFLSNFDFNRLTNSLWAKLYQCFFIHFNSNHGRIKKSRSSAETIEFTNNEQDRFNGIIRHLTKQFGGNVDDTGVCKLTSSSVLKNHVPRNAVDFDNNSLYFSATGSYGNNNWLKVDFIGRKVRPSSYSIRTWRLSRGQSHIKNWVVEASNTDRENDWKILDSRSNENCLDHEFAANTFKIKTHLENDEYFRYIRLRQNGLNSRYDYQLIVGSFEIFGTII